RLWLCNRNLSGYKEPFTFRNSIGALLFMSKTVAYFSMEIGIRADLPTYSGGLGVLAGDTLKSASDLGVPVAGITLLYRKGYFRQEIDPSGQQKEKEVEWRPETLLKKVDAEFDVEIEGRKVKVAAWRYDLVGTTGAVVPVYFLDSSNPANDPYDRTLTDSL